MSKKQLRNIILLLSFSFLSVIFFFIIINQFLLSNQTKDVILSNAKTAIEVQEKLFTSFLHKTKDQLNSLNASTNFQDFLNTRASKKVVQEHFLNLGQSDSSIMQIRFIDQNGLEQIRVDRKNINTPARLISEDKLQDKSQYDYFILSKQKPANTQWLSDLDLNIEHTEIEKPFKPTLRAILPLSQKNNFNGILIINYFMQPLLDNVSNIPLYDVIIVDNNADTLVHYDDTKSWSAYSSQKHNLKHLFPEQYKDILENTFFSSEDLVSAKLNIPFKQDLFSVLTFKKEFLQASRDKTIRSISTELILLALIALGVGIVLAKRLQTIFNENEDIRKQKKIFNDTFDNAAVGIAHVGLDGRWIRINTILSTILGYSEDELLALTFQEVTHPEDLETDLKYLNKTLLGQIDSYNIEKRYLRKDGSVFWAQLTVSLIRDQNGSPEYFISIIDDISQRKKLQTNISKYLELIDTHIITSTTDLKGRITEASEAFCAISGYTKEELVGQSHSILRHPDMPSELYQDLWDTIQEDKIWFGEIKNRTKDGGYYWVKATIAPRYDDKNVKVGYTAIRQLITDKKALEETKVHISKYLELIDMHIITSTTDLKGRITEASEAFCAISGYTKDELIGQGHNILRHPDMPSELYEDLWKTIKENKTWFGEIKNRTKDGGYYWVQATITPRFDDKNVKVGYTAIRQLITDKKALEETEANISKYLELIDTHIITSTTDLKGRITEASEAFCAISGYTKDELIGQGHNILRHPDMPSELYEDLWKTIKENKTWFGEIKNRTKNGSYYWVQATIAPRYDDKNVKVGYTAIRQLITDKKALEETKLQLQENVDELQKSQDVIVSQSRMAAIGEMLSMIAHQWRQPLAVISSELNAMHISSQLGTLSLDDVGEQVEKVQGNIQALSSIINTFRNYYGSDNEADAMRLNEITDTVISLENDQFTQNNIVLSTQLDTQAGTLLYSKQLIQVLINLMTNAIEALQKNNTEDKKIFLKTEDKAGQVIISVCDNGGGIENEILDKTFEPYFSTKDNLNGKGLGLYTSKIIIENVLKGSINIENNDEGLCVTMRLPHTAI